MTSKSQSFWDHLDELRNSLIKIFIVVVVFGSVAFFFKNELFGIVLAPKNDDFITYRLFNRIGEFFLSDKYATDSFSVQLINTGLAEQFLVHLKVAIYAGILIASPYILYLLFRFVSPALYSNEKKYALKTVGSGYIMFLLGVLLSYMLLFPLIFRFLGTYQVSAEVTNMISLHSYIDTMMMLNVMMGLIFELPILCWLFAKLGFLTVDFMKKYRRYAIVIILIVAAIITPTGDIFTLLIVSLPIYVLYEISIFIVKGTRKRGLKN